MSGTRHIAERKIGRATTRTAVILCAVLLAAGCYRQIGAQTARGTIVIEGQSFGYIYRKVGIPMERAIVRDSTGRNVEEMWPTLWDAGVPLIEISATSRILKDSDEALARSAALALCEQNTSWQRDTVEASRLKSGRFSDFYDNGVWSFVMVCK